MTGNRLGCSSTKSSASHISQAWNSDSPLMAPHYVNMASPVRAI